ncbi:hypothetical protein EDD22DRAFT_850767 [Suillus occidentalis]|nr:hypothetical protein EDD22DRAFT_850767 [Suillus occidentalis]
MIQIDRNSGPPRRIVHLSEVRIRLGCSRLGLRGSRAGNWTPVTETIEEQLNWLDSHHAETSSVQEWPVKDMLWPAMQSSRTLTTHSELQCISEAEQMITAFIKDYFNDKRREDGKFLSADYIGHWTINQYVWLDERRVWYVAANALDDIDFFAIWPVREFLWPTLEDDRPLSSVQQRLVIEAEDRCMRY